MLEFKWPTRKLTKSFLFIGSLLYLQCFIIYGFTNWWASQRELLYHLYFSWELSFPFLPQFVYVYMTLAVFLLLPMFYLNEKAIKPWAVSYVLMTLIAGSIFLAFPTALASERPLFLAQENRLFQLIYTLDMPHNLFPSLHVAYTTFALQLAMFFGVGKKALSIMFVWWLALTLSVLFIRQHHVLDIIGGLVLSYSCYRLIFVRYMMRVA